MDDLGLDPELAALLDDTPVNYTPAIAKETLFSASLEASGAGPKGPSDVDLMVKTFATVNKYLSDKPHAIFDDPSYYKKVLGNENETAQRIHNLLSKYLTCQDPKDRAVYRQQIVTAYWDFTSNLALRAGSGKIDIQKKYALRFGLLLPTLLTPEQKELFARIIEDNIYGEPVYYIDEWLHDIGMGKINPSSTDEAKTTKSDDSARFQQLLGKAQGKLQSAEKSSQGKIRREATSRRNPEKQDQFNFRTRTPCRILRRQGRFYRNAKAIPPRDRRGIARHRSARQRAVRLYFRL